MNRNIVADLQSFDRDDAVFEDETRAGTEDNLDAVALGCLDQQRSRINLDQSPEIMTVSPDGDEAAGGAGGRALRRPGESGPAVCADTSPATADSTSTSADAKQQRTVGANKDGILR